MALVKAADVQKDLESVMTQVNIIFADLTKRIEVLEAEKEDAKPVRKANGK